MSAENLVALIFALANVLVFNFEDFIFLICKEKRIELNRGSFLLCLINVMFTMLLYILIVCIIPDLVLFNISRSCLSKMFGLSVVFCVAEIVISFFTDLILKRGRKNV